MTLQLKLTSIQPQMMSKRPSYIYVEGGISGSLRVTLQKLPQIIKCSAKDHLTFIICGSKSTKQPQQNDIIANADFWAQSMLDQNREKWEVVSAGQKGNKYILEYFNPDHNKVGELVLEVKYNRGLFYQGQIQALDSMRLNLVPFYTGKCPTINFYNCLDARDQQAEFHFIEHVYRDE